MKTEDKIQKLNSALSIIDGLLLDAEEQGEVKTLYALYERVNDVYTALCHERLGIEETNQNKQKL